MADAKQQLRKEVVHADRVYWSPTGPIQVPRDMAQSWVNEFRRMSAIGRKIPVVVDHQDYAKPCAVNDPILSKPQTVGVLSDLSIDDQGRVFFAWKPKPGVIGSRKLPNLASPEFCTQGYRDATGEYGPCVLHFALTDLPVNAGQPNEWEIVDDGIARMAMPGQLRMPPQRQQPYNADFGQQSPLQIAGQPSAQSPDSPARDYPADAGSRSDDLQADSVARDPNFATVLQGLRDTLKLHLPEDTSPSNFFERVATAITAIEGERMQDLDSPNIYTDDEAADESDPWEEEENYSGGPLVQSMSLDNRQQHTQEHADPTIRRMSAEIKELRTQLNHERIEKIKERMSRLAKTGRATVAETKSRLTPVLATRMSLEKSADAIDRLTPWLEAREELPEGRMAPPVVAMGVEGGEVNDEDIDNEFVAMGLGPFAGHVSDAKKAAEVAKGKTAW